MNIPTYPEFRALIKEDKPAFDAAFREFAPLISEFTFTNLYSWRHHYQVKVARRGDFLVLRTEADPGGAFFEPIGPSLGKAVVMAEMLGTGQAKFIRVGQATKDLCVKDGRFRIEYDRDSNDYLYRTKDLIGLAGSKYDGKRNLIRQFKAKNNYTYARFDKDHVQICRDFGKRWCRIKNCDDDPGLSAERLAMVEMLEVFSCADIIAGGITISGELCAVAIGERLNLDTLVMHALKADPRITGLYQAITHEFLKNEAVGFEYVNFEEDMGIEGLRKSKLSWHPFRLIDKYKIYSKTV